MPGSPPPTNGATAKEPAFPTPPTPHSGARTLAARLLSDAKSGRTVNIKSLLTEAALNKSQTAGLLSAPDQADGNTALMLAAKNGHLDTCLLLIEYGAIVDETNRRSQTALDLAQIEGCTDVVKALEERGAVDFPTL